MHRGGVTVFSHEGVLIVLELALGKTQFMMLGCPHLVLLTHHKPLVGLVALSDLDSVGNK